MKELNSENLRSLYLKFFESKGHKIISSYSLIPENDPSVLFTTAGMHPLVPYLLGEKHPMGKRLTDVQKCVRTGDIDEVGDAAHLTFFEMMGNWSLGDYFKENMIPWSYEFLTSKEYLGIPVEKLAVSVFAGDNDAPRDETSAKLWETCGIPKDKIFYLPKENNWWIASTTGPCGPDTEMFIDRTGVPCSDNCSPACDCGRYIEIWNDVFMQFYKNADGTYRQLEQKNVDTGMGLERTLCILNNCKTVYETDLFADALKKLEQFTGKKYGEKQEEIKAFRVILDHTRTATFMLGDEKGIVPSNVDQGYILRRLIRRAVRFGRTLNLPENSLAKIAECYIEKYKDVYPELLSNREKIVEELNKEERKFTNSLAGGLREFERVVRKLEGNEIDGLTAFHLYDTFGFPIEITEELAAEKGLKVDTKGFSAAYSEHQQKSHAGSEQKFKGGLADSEVATTKLHSATHLLQAALRRVLSPDVCQKGSNITVERLRFDFNFERPMTPEEVQKTEDLVNEFIKADVPIVMEELSYDAAKASGATGLFESKYGEVVKVYTMGNISKEMCGGPHMTHTGELGHFKILKEQSSSSGVRRIKAILE